MRFLVDRLFRHVGLGAENSRAARETSFIRKGRVMNIQAAVRGSGGQADTGLLALFSRCEACDLPEYVVHVPFPAAMASQVSIKVSRLQPSLDIELAGQWHNGLQTQSWLMTLACGLPFSTRSRVACFFLRLLLI